MTEVIFSCGDKVLRVEFDREMKKGLGVPFLRWVHRTKNALGKSDLKFVVQVGTATESIRIVGSIENQLRETIAAIYRLERTGRGDKHLYSVAPLKSTLPPTDGVLLS